MLSLFSLPSDIYLHTNLLGTVITYFFFSLPSAEYYKTASILFFSPFLFLSQAKLALEEYASGFSLNQNKPMSAASYKTLSPKQSSTLEKTFKITESSYQPNLSPTTRSCPLVHTTLSIPQEWGHPTHLGRLFQCLVPLSMIQSKQPLAQLGIVPSRPVACYLRKEVSTLFNKTSFQRVIDSVGIPSLLQTEQQHSFL